MKLSATLIVAFFMAAGAWFASAEEKPAPILTALSSTTISGYVQTGTQWWQPHVCRPVRPIRMQGVVVDPPDGPPRVVGHLVRCRHAMMFIPSVTESRVGPTPNQSSRFAVSSPIRRVRRPIVQPPTPPPQPPPPPIFTNRPPGGGIIVTSLPPILRPIEFTNRPPIVVGPGSSSGVIISPLRPALTNGFAVSPVRIIPGVPEGVTLQVRQWDSTTVFSGAVLINANRPLIQLPNRNGQPPTPPPTSLTPVPQ